MNSREWDENMQKLAAMFGGAKNGRARSSGAPTAQIKTGVLSPLQEDEGRYYATAGIKESKDRLKLARVERRKEPLESWRPRAENQKPKVMAATANYTLPTIPDSGAVNRSTDDNWKATSTINAPSTREYHKAVWTGAPDSITPKK
jgi:hypothetical protein